MLLFQVDSFTTELFRGNPAGVCLPEGELSEGVMQSIAAEMNLSETAFVTPLSEGQFNLRWFTPTTEVDLCGHGTLAAAHILFNEGILPPGAEAQFQTQSGLLKVSQEGDMLIMDFPLLSVETDIYPPLLEKALSSIPMECFSDEKRFLLRFSSESEVRNLSPDLSLLKQLGRGVMVTALSDDPKWDFVSRFFAPVAGIDEDPVTGSSHSYLAPFWSSRLNKNKLQAKQVSPREGTMECELMPGERVLLKGQAVTVFRGELMANSYLR